MPVIAPVLRRLQNAQSTSGVGAQGDALVTRISDFTCYGARSLDVYPKALTPLNLGMSAMAGCVRATVFIDESGVVNDVRTIETDRAEEAAAARDLRMRRRFSPAMKDGLAVKAQLRLHLDPAANAKP
jgi:hypothetical protein